MTMTMRVLVVMVVMSRDSFQTGVPQTVPPTASVLASEGRPQAARILFSAFCPS